VTTFRPRLELDQQDWKLIEDFCKRTKGKVDCSRGELTVTKLANLLMQDVAYAIRRPGSWEGANMIQVLRSHGYGEEL
jgi:hypothetical protein